MTNIRREVEKLIDHDAVVRRGLARDIINKRALAKHLREKIQFKIGESVSLDAVINAIRRYPIKKERRPEKAEKLIKKIKISTKNKIANLALVNDSEVHNLLEKVISLINFEKGETLRIIVAVQSIKVIMDEENLDKILGVFSESKVISHARNLAELIVTFPEEAEGTPGIASKITTEFALNGINIIELMSSIPELILIVDEKDARKAYEALEELSS
jgi:aspartokinase